jgi:hypothetical protein
MITTKTAREGARRYVGERPHLFYCYYALKPRYRHLLVTPETRFVIEGFPRSGNTFAVVAFERAQRKALRVAHHLHMPAQVMLAARWRIPTLVLLRNPTDAVLSLTIRDPLVSVREALKHYVFFHEKIVEYRDAFVLGLFEEVTRDYGAVLERVNARFGTRFSPFRHTADNVESIFADIEDRHRARRNSLDEKQISRPSSLRAEIKNASRRELEDPVARELVARAEAVYCYLAALEHPEDLPP